MQRAYLSSTISNFLDMSPNEILGLLTQTSNFPVEQTQRDAWLEEIRILQGMLHQYKGSIYFEYSIPSVTVVQSRAKS